MFNVVFMLFTNFQVLLCIILAIVIAVIPDFCLKVYENLRENKNLENLKKAFVNKHNLPIHSEAHSRFSQNHTHSQYNSHSLFSQSYSYF